jgi:hypothetical protein
MPVPLPPQAFGRLPYFTARAQWHVQARKSALAMNFVPIPHEMTQLQLLEVQLAFARKLRRVGVGEHAAEQRAPSATSHEELDEAPSDVSMSDTHGDADKHEDTHAADCAGTELAGAVTCSREMQAEAHSTAPASAMHQPCQHREEAVRGSGGASSQVSALPCSHAPAPALVRMGAYGGYQYAAQQQQQLLRQQQQQPLMQQQQHMAAQRKALRGVEESW